MKNYLIIIVLLVSIFSFGQETKLEEQTHSKKESKIRMTPFVSYDINLSPKSVIDGLDIYLLNYDNFNYKIGVDIEFKFNKNLSISSGLNYSEKDFSFFSNCLSCGSIEEENHISLSYLEIPIIGIYTYKINDFEIFGQIGIVNHINVGLNIFINDNGISLHNIDSHSISGRIGAGVSYPVLGRHRLFIATNYNSGFTGAFENVDYKIKIVGIRAGLQFLL